MRTRFGILLILLATAFFAGADEKLPVLKVGSETYSNVTITSVSATDIYFTSNEGMANAKLKNLDPELQKHFHYNTTNASVAELKQKMGNALYHFRIASADYRPTTPAEMKAEMEEAIARVTEIVNQRVAQYRRTPDMAVSTYSPGWFHAGADIPDFNTVDVRATQQLDYAKNQLVTSDLNPGVVFLGRDLEFNPMTKFFYKDRSLPKKKLTTAEMLEINRLYRIIGQDKAAINKLQNH